MKIKLDTNTVCIGITIAAVGCLFGILAISAWMWNPVYSKYDILCTGTGAQVQVIRLSRVQQRYVVRYEYGNSEWINEQELSDCGEIR